MKRNLNNKFKTVLGLMLVLGTVGTTQVLAASGTYKVYLPTNAIAHLAAKKTTAQDKVGYRLNSVAPPQDGKDTYTRVKISASYGSKTLMSERVIYETAKSTTTYNYSKNLKKGDKVTFNIRGNDPNLAATANIYLNWY